MTPLIRIKLSVLLFCVYVRSQTDSGAEQVTENIDGTVPGTLVDYEQTPSSYNGESMPGDVMYAEETPNGYNGESVPDFNLDPNVFNGNPVPEQVTDFDQVPNSYNGDILPGQVPDYEQTAISYNSESEQGPYFDQTPNDYGGSIPGQATDFEQMPNGYSSDFIPISDHTTTDYGDQRPVTDFEQTQYNYHGESVPEETTNIEQPPNDYTSEPVPEQVTDFNQVPSGYSGDPEQTTEGMLTDRTGESAPGQVTGFDQIPNGYNGLDSRPGFSVVRPPGFPLPPGLQSIPLPPGFPLIPRPPIPAVPIVPAAIPPPIVPPVVPPIMPPQILQAVVPVLPAGFVCVPAGTCPAPINNGIDIRIVTPGMTTPCPAGQVPCNTGGNSQCGLRFVTNVNTVDGPTTAGAYPWQVYLVNQTGYAGSGALLDQFHVLTAAHKVYMNGGSPNMIGVYLGVYNPAQLGMRYTVARVFVHPNFNPSNLFNDLALLRLSTPVTPLPQQNVNTACLPTQGQTFLGQNCWVSGWGQTAFNANNAPTVQQRQVQVPIVAYGTCYASMSNVTLLGANVNTYLDPVGELCAGGQGSRDACTQDGGSPLVCSINGRFTIAGLVIWGKGCGQQGVYGVYVNIANYVTWITSSIAMLNG